MTRSALTKLTVNLLPEAYEALETAAERTGLTRTDAVNKALIMFELTTRPVPAGRQAEITDRDDPSLRLIKVSTERLTFRASVKAIVTTLFGRSS